jgi:hypothetical protein
VCCVVSCELGEVRCGGKGGPGATRAHRGGAGPSRTLVSTSTGPADTVRPAQLWSRTPMPTSIVMLLISMLRYGPTSDFFFTLVTTFSIGALAALESENM